MKDQAFDSILAPRIRRTRTRQLYTWRYESRKDSITFKSSCFEACHSSAVAAFDLSKKAMDPKRKRNSPHRATMGWFRASTFREQDVRTRSASFRAFLTNYAEGLTEKASTRMRSRSKGYGQWLMRERQAYTALGYQSTDWTRCRQREPLDAWTRNIYEKSTYRSCISSRYKVSIKYPRSCMSIMMITGNAVIQHMARLKKKVEEKKLRLKTAAQAYGVWPMDRNLPALGML